MGQEVFIISLLIIVLDLLYCLTFLVTRALLDKVERQ